MAKYVDVKVYEESFSILVEPLSIYELGMKANSFDQIKVKLAMGLAELQFQPQEVINQKIIQRIIEDDKDITLDKLHYIPVGVGKQTGAIVILEVTATVVSKDTANVRSPNPGEVPESIRICLEDDGIVQYFPWYHSLEDLADVPLSANEALNFIRSGVPFEIAMSDPNNKYSNYETNPDDPSRVMRV